MVVTVTLVCMYAVADPDLPIKGWGSGGSQKHFFFSALLASVWSKNPVGVGSGGGGRGRAPALDPPLTCTCMLWEYAFRTAAT